MPAPPAAEVPKRWSSTYAAGSEPRKEALDEPQARIRARRRPLDTADAVLARRAIQPGATARGQSGHLSRRNRSIR